jgi:hypothetical protein
VYVFMVEIAFVICLASSARVYATKIKHTGLSTTLVVLTCMCIMALVMKVGVGMYVAGRDPGSAIALARAAMAMGPEGAGVPVAPTKQPLTASGARTALQSAMASMTNIKVPASAGALTGELTGAPSGAAAPAVTGIKVPTSVGDLVGMASGAAAAATPIDVASVPKPEAMAAATKSAMNAMASLVSNVAPSTAPVSTHK